MKFQEMVEQFKNFRNPLFHSSVMCRKEAVIDIGGYDENLPCLLDLDLYVRMSRCSKIANIDERLSLKRVHSKQFFGGEMECIFLRKASERRRRSSAESLTFLERSESMGDHDLAIMDDAKALEPSSPRWRGGVLS